MSLNEFMDIREINNYGFAVTPTEIGVLNAVAQFVNKDTHCCFPTYEQIAEICGYARRTVITAMNKFIKLGWIVKEIRIKANRFKSNMYHWKLREYLDKLRPKTEKEPPKISGDRGSPSSDRGSLRLVKELVKKEVLKTMCDFDFDNDFAKLWSIWPHRVNKKKAVSILKRILKDKKRMDGLTPAEFMQRLISHTQASIEAQVLGFDKLHLTTYLNGDRWEDEIQADLYKPQDKLKNELQSYLAKHKSLEQDVTPTPHAALELDPVTGRWSAQNGHRINS